MPPRRGAAATLALAAILGEAHGASKAHDELRVDLDAEVSHCGKSNNAHNCTLRAMRHLAEKARMIEVAAKGELNEFSDLRARGPPEVGTAYGGMTWPDITVRGADPTHIFVIGDWGGMDGTLWANMKPPGGRARIICYPGGAVPGPSVFPRSRGNSVWNRLKVKGTRIHCGHHDFVACYNPKKQCKRDCGYVDDVDAHPQILVANQFKKYAAKLKPKYVLNVGDNFYWGGIEHDCGHDMGTLSYEARHQFDQIFEGIYKGPGLDGVPWISVLGNHDWGGRVFNNGWDQQIAYTWHSPRWIMPAPYYSLRVNYPDQGFDVDYFMIDSNTIDAMEGWKDSEHNICGFKHNSKQASCAAAGGPPSLALCKPWFDELWATNQRWLERKLAASKATWQIIMTHFPCGENPKWYRKLKGMGLDLLVTGHRHDQELWDEKHRRSKELDHLPCIVAGGGGGITSEATPVTDDGNWYGEGQYGFYDLLITKKKIVITSVDYRGTKIKSATIHPSNNINSSH